MKNYSLAYIMRYALALSLVLFQVSASADPYQGLGYDPGPNLDASSQSQEAYELQKDYIKIIQDIPFFPGISKELNIPAPPYKKGQKFRPVFGPTPTRGPLQQNSVKVLFIGQDGTHMAEGANRPGIAGFGGRAHDVAAHFGIVEGAMFMNTYSYTISGQYGVYQTPIIQNRDGQARLITRSYVDNRLWAMTHDGPIAQWRNDLIDWVIRNNRESLKLIILFGGSSRDAIGSFVNAKGGVVLPRTSERTAKTYSVPKLRLDSGELNNEAAIIVDKDGNDLDLDEVEENLEEALEQMVFNTNGPLGNGTLDAAQFGGYNLDKMKTNKRQRQFSRSLKGLKLSDGSLAPNVLVMQSPHPSSLSKMTNSDASASVNRALEVLEPYAEEGWQIESDTYLGKKLTNKFAEGTPYRYLRSDVPKSHHDAGAAANRVVGRSSAGRNGAEVIVIGSRNRNGFDRDTLDRMKKMQEASLVEQFAEEKILTGRPQSEALVDVFDRGPLKAFSTLLFDYFNENKLDEIFDTNAVSVHRSVEDYGHYRGTFKTDVLVLADPDGYDEILTSRAMTGMRGQYLQGMMNELGYATNHLIIRTVPFAMDRASDSDWEEVLNITADYRQNLLKEVFATNEIKVIITDGKYAASEIEKYAPEDVSIVKIRRRGLANNTGIVAAQDELAEAFNKEVHLSGNAANIPREHLPYYARTWEGTSGDRVITKSSGNEIGKAFAIVAPRWASRKRVELPPKTAAGVQELKERLEGMGY